MANAKRDAQGRFATNSNGSNDQSSNGQKTVKDVMNARGAREQILNMAYNEQYSRSQLYKRLIDPRRDINHECGYPETSEITSQDYKDMYDREAIAARVVEIWPKECWGVVPSVVEAEGSEKKTEFEVAWDAVGRNLTGSPNSKFRSEDINPVWDYLRRIDIRSGIGSFGILLIGFSDGGELHEPVVRQEGLELIYLNVLDESQVNILEYEKDKNNPRFGKPTMYDVTLNDRSSTSTDQTQVETKTQKVHWTRVLHVADDKGSNQIFATPRCRPVYNRLYDLRKLYSGSAEMYWLGAFPGLSFETHPQLGTDIEVDGDTIKDMMELYSNGLQRFLAPEGMSIKSLAPQVVDPSAQIDTQIEAICIVLSTPKRIFVGSERGELASSQDKITWNERLAGRQNGYITPGIIAPFIDRLVDFGVLPEPDSYTVVWPDMNSLSAVDQATITTQRMDALMKYVAGNVEAIMHPMDLFTRELGYSNKEATAIVDLVLASDEQFTETEDTEDDIEEPLPGVSR